VCLVTVHHVGFPTPDACALNVTGRFFVLVLPGDERFFVGFHCPGKCLTDATGHFL
jgi:hypothetical protein